MIDWTNFTPWLSLTGGLCIGVAASALFLVHGRIAGISGILGGLLRPTSRDVEWRIAFVGGLVSSPLVYLIFSPLPVVDVEATTPLLIGAGLLVGIGTRYGSGCTSGHGVCGIARLSPRSIVATLVFIVTGFITVFVMHHLLS